MPLGLGKPPGVDGDDPVSFVTTGTHLVHITTGNLGRGIHPMGIVAVAAGCLRRMAARHVFSASLPVTAGAIWLWGSANNIGVFFGNRCMAYRATEPCVFRSPVSLWIDKKFAADSFDIAVTIKAFSIYSRYGFVFVNRSGKACAGKQAYQEVRQKKAKKRMSWQSIHSGHSLITGFEKTGLLGNAFLFSPFRNFPVCRRHISQPGGSPRYLPELQVSTHGNKSLPGAWCG